RAKEMGAVCEGRRSVAANELKPGIMNQRRRLERVTRSFPGELLLRHPVELRINQIEQLLLSFALTAFSRFKQAGYIAHAAAEYKRPRPCQQSQRQRIQRMKDRDFAQGNSRAFFLQNR